MARRPEAGDAPATLADGTTVHLEPCRCRDLRPGDQLVVGGALATVTANRYQRDRGGRVVHRVELRLADGTLRWADGRPNRPFRRVASYPPGQ
jgi:hypothetical protein